MAVGAGKRGTVRTFKTYETTVYRYRNSLEHIFSELVDAGVPSTAYITFREHGADYTLTARWEAELTQQEVNGISELKRQNITEEDAPLLVAEIAKHFDVTVDDVRSAKKRANLVDARTVIALALAARGLGCVTIGQLMNRHHTSVIHLMKRGRKVPEFRSLATAF